MFGQTGPEKKKRKKKSEENGFQRFYSIKLKKINFYKFILVYWRIKKKWISIFCVSSSK